MAVQDEVPKSRITLVYKTEVDGEPNSVDLPLRLMIPADFSMGTSKDRKVDLDQRAPRNIDGSNANDLMRDMGISLALNVPNRINGGNGETMDVNLSISSMESFSPHEIAQQVPQIRALLLFKKLLEEIQSNIANKKEFSQLLNKLYSDEEALAKVRGELEQYAPTLPKAQIADSQQGDKR
jgi:type VI secretion system protein ImpB